MNLVPQPPEVKSKRDLALCEVFDIETGAFLRSTFAFVDEHNFAWFGQNIGTRKRDLTLEDVKQTLVRVRDDQIYPLVTPLITEVPNVNVEKLFIKRPQLLCLDNEDETRLLPRMLIEEAEVLEVLRRDPHPNLVSYHGCVIARGRITGIALEHHSSILQYRFEDDKRDFDLMACLDGLRAGLVHLHSLGYAHNDLNPMNIALTKDDTPIILDFGSCKKFGEQLTSAGTPGWIDENYTTSAQQHDQSAVARIEAWLIEEAAKRMT